jgi:hypothetical protein
MPVTNPNPPVLVPKPLNDGPLPTAPEPDNPPQGVVTLFTGFTGGLVGTLVGRGGELASVYRDLADREGNRRRGAAFLRACSPPCRG